MVLEVRVPSGTQTLRMNWPFGQSLVGSTHLSAQGTIRCATSKRLLVVLLTTLPTGLRTTGILDHLGCHIVMPGVIVAGSPKCSHSKLKLCHDFGCVPSCVLPFRLLLEPSPLLHGHLFCRPAHIARKRER